MLRFDWTPFFCFTRYQKALSRAYKKVTYKLHKELDLSNIIKRGRESHNLVRSFAESKVFSPETLKKDYEAHYTNVIDISMDTDKSIQMENASPLEVLYKDPTPVC